MWTNVLLAFEALILAAALLVAASILWHSMCTGISPMPSSTAAARAMVAMAAGEAGRPIVDLGSGFGHLAIRCARAFPERKVIGFEVSWVPWCVSCIARHVLRVRNLELRRADFRQADLPGGAVWLCYLFRAGMQDLSQRLERESLGKSQEESRGPVLLLSNTFSLPGATPQAVVCLDDFYRTRIFAYRPDFSRKPRAQGRSMSRPPCVDLS